MRPRSLTFSGLRSYRTKTTVDFEDHDLFAIIGDTGAGKSTVIEALCFALYGRSTWSGKDKQDLIADDCDRMSIELDFDADGRSWKVRRSRGRSAGSNIDELEAVGGHAFSVDGSSDVRSRIEELVGLDFQQFIRAVVLPQGRFDELLRSTESERNKILKSVLGLSDVVAVADEIRSIRDETKGIRERYEERRSHYPEDPPAVLEEATASYVRSSKKLEQLDAAIKAISGPRRLIEASASLTALSEALDTVPSLDDDPLDVLRICLNRGLDLDEQRTKLTDAIDRADTAIAQVDAAIATALAGFDDRDGLKLAATRARDAIAELPNATKQLAKARAHRSDLDSDAPTTAVDPALQLAVNAARSELKRCQEDRDDATGQESKARIQADQLIEARAKLQMLEEASAEEASKIERAKNRRDEADEAYRRAKELLEQAELDEKVARRADAAASAAAGHQPGDDCPVCAQTLPSNFEAPRSGDIELSEQAKARAGEVADETHSAATKAAQLVASLTQAADHARQAHEDQIEELDRLTLVLTDTGADPSAADVKNIIAPMTARSEKLAREFDEAQSELDGKQAQLAAATAEHAAAVAHHQGEVQAADKAVTQAERDVSRLTSDLVATWPARWRPNGDVTVEALTDCAGRLNSTVERIDQLNDDRSCAQYAKSDAERDMSEVRVSFSEEVTGPAKDAIAGLNSYLSRVADVQSKATIVASAVDLESSPPSELDNVDPSTGADELSATIRSVETQLSIASAVVASAVFTAKAARTVVATAQQQIDQTLRELECESIDSLIGAQGNAKEAVRTAEKELKAAKAGVDAAAKVDEVLGVVVPFGDNLEVLVEALRDKQFIDHLLERREAELLAEAARRLKTISNNRFVFVSDFGIKNTASGEIRSADSLSGGERFQASLALALALVEIASRGGGRLDAVFVDEGFGSLDANSLDTVLGALGKIAGAGKMVALISHLRSVADYVDTVMHVTRDDAAGSRIRTLSPEERDALLADDIRSGLTG